MRRFAQLLILISCSLSLQSQNLQSFQYLGDTFNGYYYIGWAFSHGNTQNNAVPGAENHRLTGNFMELNLKYHDYDRGHWQYDIRAKMYTDVIKQLADMILGNNESAYTALENTGLSTGPLGWHTCTYNLLSGRYLNISPGAHLNDYFYFANARESDTDARLSTKEPQGYYFAAGPSIMLSLYASRFLMINLKSQYSFAYWRPISAPDAIEDDSYPLPQFFGFTTELLTPWGLYFEVDHNRLINKGPNPNAGMRTDFNIGFKFVVN